MSVIISDPEKAMDEAQKIDRPCVAFDTSNGSNRARYFLVDYNQRGVPFDTMPPGSLFEMTRICFNRMRDRGMLKNDLADRLKFHERCQAWPVIKA